MALDDITKQKLVKELRSLIRQINKGKVTSFSINRQSHVVDSIIPKDENSYCGPANGFNINLNVSFDND